MNKISLSEYFRTSKFGELSHPMTEQHVLDYLGEPEDYMTGDDVRDWRDSIIWKYGEVEFHFGRGLRGSRPVSMIFADDFGALESTPKMPLDSMGLVWDMPFIEAVDLLHAKGVRLRLLDSHEILAASLAPDERFYMTQAEVVLHFAPDDPELHLKDDGTLDDSYREGFFLNAFWDKPVTSKEATPTSQNT